LVFVVVCFTLPLLPSSSLFSFVIFFDLFSQVVVEEELPEIMVVTKLVVILAVLTWAVSALEDRPSLALSALTPAEVFFVPLV
jgi:hypothetical protein